MRLMLACWLTVLLGCAAPTSLAARAEIDPAQMDFAESSPAESPKDRRSSPQGNEASAPQEPAPQRADRQVVYSASLRLVVVSASESMAQVQRFTEEVGGHLSESHLRSITVRVPAKDFDTTLARISRLGEVVDRQVRAADVTEEMLDLNIRLENARRTRERLLEHLSKSTEINSTLKIEAELSRVSGEIEQMEGKLRLLQSQIAMSTIKVEFNVLAPGRAGSDRGLGLPFKWIEALGDGLVAGNVEKLPRKSGWLFFGPKFDPPADFIRYYQTDTQVEAMNAGGIRIKIREQENFDEGALSFWSKLARKALVESRAMSVGEERDLGEDRALIAGTREVAGQDQGYMLMLARTSKQVYSFEAWGPKSAFDAQYESLVKSAKSLRR